MRRLATVLFFSIFFSTWSIPARAQYTDAGVEKFRVAVEAPDLILKDINGGKVSLKELRGKIILLNFFATW